MKKGLDQLVEERDQFDDDSKAFIDSLRFAQKDIDAIDSMKRTSGWKILDAKIREELKQRINDLVKDDLKIQTLLALLSVTDTKTMSKTLESAVSNFLPDG